MLHVWFNKFKVIYVNHTLKLKAYYFLFGLVCSGALFSLGSDMGGFKSSKIDLFLDFHNINGININGKNKTNKMISIDVSIVFDNIQYPFMTKINYLLIKWACKELSLVN